MKYALFSAGLLLAVCGAAYAENSSGRINVQLTIHPSCAVESLFNQYQMACNIASVSQPKITESCIPIEQTTISAAKTENSVETRLITVEW
ncbi:hypothetical protein BIY29_12690 [Brenneria alni]|uniref:Uncharacterized protein n=1 Tax=Brenneria alni TaxID=71656 RepID=A0A421DMA9_9GAMM|nr:hypothetical protein [Brenneria alni]RLM22113.1 hypothetical protein BIY29_12690 [Brenneria alni]